METVHNATQWTTWGTSVQPTVGQPILSTCMGQVGHTVLSFMPGFLTNHALHTLYGDKQFLACNHECGHRHAVRGEGWSRGLL